MMRTSDVSRGSVYLILVVAVVATLLPIIWMVGASLKPLDQVFTRPVEWIPHTIHVENYANAWQARPFGRYLFNSILAAGASTLVTLVLGSAAAYSFARYRYPGRGVLFLVVLSTLMIPLEAIVIPLYLEIQALGWVNSYLGLVVPTALAPIGIFILRQAMLGVPQDYLDAGRVDGAGEIFILTRILLPLIRPALVSVAIFPFTLSWNSYLWPLIAVNDDELRTMPLGMALFENQLIARYNEIMAVAVIGALPLVFLFVVLQRQFVEGVTATGVRE
jgi:ABC-type glycerol-3-phosphate transport system permease component